MDKIKLGFSIQEKKRKKRQAIIDAAIKVFASQGYHNTKIYDISKLAEVAEGTLYLYFKNKDVLFFSAFTEIMEDKLKNLQDQIDQIDDKLEKLLQFFSIHIDTFINNPNTALFIVKEMPQSSEFYEKFPTFRPLKEYKAYLKKLCQDAIDEGLIRKIDTDILVTIMLGTLNFSITEWIIGNNKRSLHEIKDKAVDIIYNGLISPEKM